MARTNTIIIIYDIIYSFIQYFFYHSVTLKGTLQNDIYQYDSYKLLEIQNIDKINIGIKLQIKYAQLYIIEDKIRFVNIKYIKKH